MSEHVRKAPWPAFALAVFALAALTAPLAFRLTRRAEPGGAGNLPAVNLPADMTVPELLDKLRLLSLRAVPNQRNGRLADGFYLTRTDKGWEDLAAAPLDPTRPDRWHGTVLCTRRRHAGAGEALRPRLEAGPFLFYGDKTLLAEISAALGR